MSEQSTLVGGSTAGRVINCPASVRMSKAIAPAPENEYTRRGTALHWVLEQHLLDEQINLQEGMIVHGHTLTVDDLIAVDDAKIAVDELFKQYDIVEFEPEGKVSYGSIPGAFGTCDLVARTETGELVIADFKFGEGVLVSPMHNSQFLFYAGAVIDGPEFRDWVVNDDTKVHLAVIQPAQNKPLQVWTTDVHSVVTYIEQLKVAVKLTDDPTVEPNSGDHCRWCPAFAVCPKHIREAEAVSRLKNEHLNDLGVAMALADELEPWIRKVRKTAHEQLELGADVPGYKLVASQARRTWIDPDAALATLKRLRKLSRQDYLDEKLLTVAQLEKACKHKGVDFDQFDDYYSLVSKGTAVVPESDSRQGIKKSSGRDIPEGLDKLLTGKGN